MGGGDAIDEGDRDGGADVKGKAAGVVGRERVLGEGKREQVGAGGIERDGERDFRGRAGGERGEKDGAAVAIDTEGGLHVGEGGGSVVADGGGEVDFFIGEEDGVLRGRT